MSQNFLHYTITSTLERRAAAATYLAVHDRGPARTVALKIFQRQGFTHASEQETFLRETEKFSLLSNPHIVPMIEAGVEGEQAYIVSEYMSNGSLRVRMDRAYPQRLPFQQAMTIITQVGQGLSYLHARYLIHGQLKPEHILFDANGRALLSDPYCSTRPAPWAADNENANDAYRYLAPEQFEGEYNALSDQYALCCVAYELLTGRPPFTLRDPQALEEQQKYVLPSPLIPILPDLAPTIEQAILKGLSKEPSQRHADIVSFLSALQASKTGTAPDLPLPRARRGTKSLVPSIPIAPPMPAKNASGDLSASAITPKSAPKNPPETIAAFENDKDGVFSSPFDTKTPKQKRVMSQDNALESSEALDDFSDMSASHLQNGIKYLDDFADTPPSHLQNGIKHLDDFTDTPPSRLQERNKHLDDIFNMPPTSMEQDFDAGTLDDLLQEMTLEDELHQSKQSAREKKSTPPVKAKASNAETIRPPDQSLDQKQQHDSRPEMTASLAQNSTSVPLDEFLQELALEDELLMLEKNTYSQPSAEYKADKFQSIPADENEYEDDAVVMLPHPEDKTAVPLSQPEADTIKALPRAVLPRSTSYTPDVNNTLAAPAAYGYGVVKFSASTPLAQTPAQPALKSGATQSSSNIFSTSLDNVSHWKFFSRRTILWALLLLLMIGSIMTYTALAATTPQSSSLALSATVTAPTPRATIDSLGILPPDTAKQVPTTKPTPKPTAKPTPKPKPKPKPKPTPKPTPTSAPIFTATPTQVPVYIPPVIPPTATPKPKPTATPVPGPTLLYSNTVATSSSTTNVTTIAFVPGLSVTNTRIEGDLVTQGNGGGLVFRGGYRLRIGTDGTYDLVTSSTGLASGSSSAIRQGNSVSNHVTIIDTGHQITVSVNGTRIINLQDSTYSSGSVGIMANDFGTATTTTCVLKVYTD